MGLPVHVSYGYADMLHRARRMLYGCACVRTRTPWCRRQACGGEKGRRLHGSIMFVHIAASLLCFSFVVQAVSPKQRSGIGDHVPSFISDTDSLREPIVVELAFARLQTGIRTTRHAVYRASLPPAPHVHHARAP